MRKNHPYKTFKGHPNTPPGNLRVKKFTPNNTGLPQGQRTSSKLTNASALLGVQETKAGPFEEMGVMGAKVSHGYVYEDFLPVLQGATGRRTLREMSDNDATVGAVLFAIEMVLRSVSWYVKSRDRDEEEELFTPEDLSQHYTNTVITDEEQGIAFVKSVLFKDMEHTWDDFIGQVLTMLVYGWQYTEIVWKRRVGPFQKDLKFKSHYSDGMVGIRKLADRSQETLDRWVVDDHGNLFGLVQQHPYGGSQVFIPIERALHFRPKLWKGSPEGRSAIRNAYRPYFFLKNLQEIEAIAEERELNGFPVIYAPGGVINGKTAEAKTAAASYLAMVRDIKFNEQGGAVLPSDPYVDDEGKPSNVKQVELQLLNSGGSRSMDINKTIIRYQGDILRTVLADFMILGSDGKGSYALSKNKSDLFLLSLTGWLESIASVINRDLIPRLWRRNNIDPEFMPSVVPGAVAPDDLGILGKYVADLSAAGMFMADGETEDHLRDAAGLPERSEEMALVDMEEEEEE